MQTLEKPQRHVSRRVLQFENLAYKDKLVTLSFLCFVETLKDGHEYRETAWKMHC